MIVTFLDVEKAFDDVWHNGFRCKRAYGVNFGRTFVLSILLYLDLACSNLAQTLFNPLKSKLHCLFLLGVPAVFANAKECSLQNIVVSIKL